MPTLTDTAREDLRLFALQLRAHGLRVFWLNSFSGMQIKVYSEALDSFADVYLRTPQHIWVYGSDRRPSRENGTGLCVVESYRLHPAHVLEALQISRYHEDRTTMQDFEKRLTCPNWTEIV